MVAIVVPDIEVAHRILLLNTEKAHNLRERSLEVIRLAELLSQTESRPEGDFEIEFEEPALLTIGLCYQENGRFAGGAYHPVLRRAEKWLERASAESTGDAAGASRQGAGAGSGGDRGDEAAEGTRLRQSLSPSVRGRPDQSPPIQAGRQSGRGRNLDTMLAAARRFDAGRVRADQVAKAGGATEDSGSTVAAPLPRCPADASPLPRFPASYLYLPLTLRRRRTCCVPITPAQSGFTYTALILGLAACSGETVRPSEPNPIKRWPSPLPCTRR